MPQTPSFTLKYVTEQIQAKIELQFPSSFWVKAEINKLGYNTFSKHAYPELVEKVDGKIVAQMPSTLFSKTYQWINEKFINTLQEPLKDGITALLHVKIQYNPIYGLSLNILDIDPSYTLGELEKERIESIAKLKAQGIFERNKNLKLPLLIQRIAVISGEGTQGCSDFLNVLMNNEFGYKFHVTVFSAVMQGDAAVQSIVNQLNLLKGELNNFDCVVIIRGGGGNVGMTCYNKFEMAQAIATFPKPVFTGIGHSTNEFVADLVAHKSSITPTGIATFLVNYMRQTEEGLNTIRNILSGEVLERLRSESYGLDRLNESIKSVTKQYLAHKKDNQQKWIERFNHKVMLQLQEAKWNQKQFAKDLKYKSQYVYAFQIPQIKQIQKDLDNVIRKKLNQDELKLETLAETVRLLDPQCLLNRGYSITYDSDGNIVKNTKKLKKGQQITTQLAEGKLNSVIQDIHPKV